MAKCDTTTAQVQQMVGLLYERTFTHEGNYLVDVFRQKHLPQKSTGPNDFSHARTSRI